MNTPKSKCCGAETSFCGDACQIHKQGLYCVKCKKSCTTVPEREENVVPHNHCFNYPEEHCCVLCCFKGCGVSFRKNPPSERQEAEGWTETFYRMTEKLLNDFKNKRMGYSEFIEKQTKYISQTRKEVALKTLEEVEKIIESEKIVCGACKGASCGHTFFCKDRKRILSSLSTIKKSLNER